MYLLHGETRTAGVFLEILGDGFIFRTKSIHISGQAGHALSYALVGYKAEAMTVMLL